MVINKIIAAHRGKWKVPEESNKAMKGLLEMRVKLGLKWTLGFLGNYMCHYKYISMPPFRAVWCIWVLGNSLSVTDVDIISFGESQSWEKLMKERIWRQEITERSRSQKWDHSGGGIYVGQYACIEILVVVLSSCRDPEQVLQCLCALISSSIKWGKK